MPWKDWSAERLGVVLAVLAALGFSFKAIFVKLAYAAAPVDAVTLLSLRMVFSLPAFLWVGFAASRSAPPLTRNDWGMLGALGLLGYYGASILDFLGLQYISAALERLILFTYPTLTVLIGVLFMGKSLARREVAALLSYAGIALAFAHDLQVAGEMTDGADRRGWSSAPPCPTLYLAGSAPAIQRLGAARFTALAMLVSTLATQLHFLATQSLSALRQPPTIYAYGLAMAVVSTVLPVFMQSAAIRRIGSAKAVLIGTLGPLLTIVLRLVAARRADVGSATGRCCAGAGRRIAGQPEVDCGGASPVGGAVLLTDAGSHTLRKAVGDRTGSRCPPPVGARYASVDVVLGVVDVEFSGRRDHAWVLDDRLELARLVVDDDDRRLLAACTPDGEPDLIAIAVVLGLYDAWNPA
jgi:drug/metabolite transporter (DMT)-like permease